MSTKVIFLDRDGVINQFPGKGEYVVKESQMKVLPSALRGIASLKQAGYRLFVISNQGCVSRGMITRTGLQRITESMLKKIHQAGGEIDRVFYCMHQLSDNCKCKKPKILLLEKAVRNLKVNREKIYFIGDSQEDIQAGHDFGCRTILVTCGRSKKKDIQSFPFKPDFVKKDLYEAAQWLIRKKS